MFSDVSSITNSNEISIINIQDFKLLKIQTNSIIESIKSKKHQPNTIHKIIKLLKKLSKDSKAFIKNITFSKLKTHLKKLGLHLKTFAKTSLSAKTTVSSLQSSRTALLSIDSILTTSSLQSSISSLEYTNLQKSNKKIEYLPELLKTENTLLNTHFVTTELKKLYEDVCIFNFDLKYLTTKNEDNEKETYKEFTKQVKLTRNPTNKSHINENKDFQPIELGYVLEY